MLPEPPPAALRLRIDREALAGNWTALDRLSGKARAGAAIKADAYGLGAAVAAPVLWDAGARDFFVAHWLEVPDLLNCVPPPAISVLHGPLDARDAAYALATGTKPVINSLHQAQLWLAAGGGLCDLMVDSGINRLGLPLEALGDEAIARLEVDLLMSHLACADDPDHGLNLLQLANFHAMTDGTGLPRSLSATAGILLGPAFHFDLTRPGIGLYGGRPYEGAARVVTLQLPVIQTRLVAVGEPVGYACTWVAERPSLIATVQGGYADGVLRSLSNAALLWAGEDPCPVVGRISMDLITVDVTHLAAVPEMLTLIGPQQSVDQLADTAGTIGYEILTGLGPRLKRRYLESRR